MLAELENGGNDATLVVEMVERVSATTAAQPVQVVPPQPAPVPAPAPQPVERDGSSEEAAVEVMASKRMSLYRT